MATEDRLVESVKVLLKSVRQLSDRFVENEEKLTRSFEGVDHEMSDLLDRVEHIEEILVPFRDAAALPQRVAATPELPVKQGSVDQVVPTLNLTLEDILDVYRNTPILLEPFSRPCSLGARTLSGEIDQVELEIFAQGSTWALETLDRGWILLPKPGSLERRAQLQSLERLFEVQDVTQLPATLHLLDPATAVVVEFGRRWALQEKGLLNVNSDPLYQSTSQRLRQLEQRIGKLESALEQAGD